MAPRRGARILKVERSLDYDNLTVKEVLCPICRSILIEPVTLPCNHVFCSSCFQGTMENANLVCPLCRMRIGSWLRSSKKENKLINVEYWNAIKRLFPEQIKNKLEGVEDNFSYEDSLIQLAKPGELKKEYETQIKKETEIFRKEREAEMKASEALIKKLKEEEEYQRIIEEEKLRLDEEIARKLAQELNAVKDHPTDIKNSKSSNNNLRKSGPLDKFLVNKSMESSASQPVPSKQNEEKTIDYAKKDYTCRILCHDIGNDWVPKEKTRVVDNSQPTLSMLNHQISLELQQVLDLGCHSDSSDSIESECRYFKPIDYRRNIPCQRTTPIKVPAIKGDVKCKSIISAPRGQHTLKNDALHSAFAAFGNLVLEEKSSKPTRSPTKRNSIRTGKNQIESPEKAPTIKSYVGSDMKKSNNVLQSKKTPEKEDQNATQVKNEVNSSVKRKYTKTSPEYLSPKKKNKLDLDNSYSRLLESPTSPFLGFSKTHMEDNALRKRSTRNTRIKDSNTGNHVEETKINLQVKSDYELAKKLQEHFNNSSYATRSSAPSRGTKVCRQTTLDSLLSRKSKYKH